MRPSKRVGAGREGSPSQAASERVDADSLDDHGTVGKQAQRAMVAGRLATLPKGANQHASIEAPTQTQAAELLNVSRPSVQRARKVLAHGNPELIAAVERGEVSAARTDCGTAGEQAAADLAEFFASLDIGLDQLYDAADALRHLGQSIGSARSTPDECIGDLNQIASMIYSGAVSVLDAVGLRITVHEVRR